MVFQIRRWDKSTINLDKTECHLYQICTKLLQRLYAKLKFGKATQRQCKIDKKKELLDLNLPIYDFYKGLSICRYETTALLCCSVSSFFIDQQSLLFTGNRSRDIDFRLNEKIELPGEVSVFERKSNPGQTNSGDPCTCLEHTNMKSRNGLCYLSEIGCT